MTIQFVKTEGDAEVVVMSRGDYDRLLARAGDPSAEDRMTLAVAKRAKAAVAAGTDTVLPGWFAEIVIEHGNVYKGLRRLRHRTQHDVASAAGISQGYLSDLERGLRVPSTDVIDALAATFSVEPEWLYAIERSRIST